MAFDWIKRNIAAFGGDSNRIIAFGQSAGGKLLKVLSVALLHKLIWALLTAASVSLHMLAYGGSRPLFRGAVS